MTDVLDASAIIAHLANEPGAEQIAAVLTREDLVYISTANVSEVLYIIERRHSRETAAQVFAVLTAPPFVTVPVSNEIAARAAQIRIENRLAFADALAAATALELGATLWTADFDFRDVATLIDVNFLR